MKYHLLFCMTPPKKGKGKFFEVDRLIEKRKVGHVSTTCQNKMIYLIFLLFFGMSLRHVCSFMVRIRSILGNGKGGHCKPAVGSQKIISHQPYYGECLPYITD